MRMMMKIVIPVEASNKAVQDGSVRNLLKSSFEALKPEAVYFVPDAEGRCILVFFDLEHSSDLPAAAEPFRQAVNASVTFTPVMNQQDFQTGQAKAHR
ncbi:MAG: panthothenate synthetase [Rubrivivax sp.]